jgi:hypothetical protein
MKILSESVALNIYNKNNLNTTISIYDRFSIVLLFQMCWQLVRKIHFNRNQSNIKLSSHLLPFPRFSIIDRLNKKILIICARLLTASNNTYSVLWILNPNYYFLHNAINWQVAVFDYNNQYKSGDYLFSKYVAGNNLVFIYYKNRTSQKIDMFFIRKKPNLVYRDQIWKRIHSILN